PVGEGVATAAMEEELAHGGYKLVTVTHVDTSTGVRMDVSKLGELGRKYGVLTVVDGVCSVAGEEIRQEEWKLDVVLTASQKAVGVPPGLALLMVSPKALETFHARRRPVGSYYADWSKWLPVMKAYESRTPSYFGTPAVNLVAALDVSLGQILAEGMAARFARHALLAKAFQAGMDAVKLNQVPTKPSNRANTLTACYTPEGIGVAALLEEIRSAGAIVAGGLHPAIKDRTFRVGHMGAVRAADVLATVGAIETGLRRVGHRFDAGAGVAAVQRALLS
ncbi:MAG: aminotransferase class V-fold PLP-dependent enzyme, partial [Candidatus Bipolaricaulis sp.]|nr:aminotransferase class V-fold PLP-dependent enzyme [Candidatus Bipolaricaulis sp.]